VKTEVLCTETVPQGKKSYIANYKDWQQAHPIKYKAAELADS